MRAIRTYGSVRGALSNGRPYRDNGLQWERAGETRRGDGGWRQARGQPGKGMKRFDGCFGARAGIQARLFGVGGLIQAAVGLSGGVGGLLTKRSGLAWNASSRVCWRAA